MKKMKFPEEKILEILRDSEGKTIASICRKHSITPQTFYRWREKYEGLKVNEMKKIRDMEEENRKLRKIVTDLNLDIHALKEVIRKKL